MALVQQARRAEFYDELGVPDTLDGRFEMIALHAFLVMRRLKGNGREAQAVGRRLYEILVDDFDQSLREMGAGDVGVGRRVKAMVRALHARIVTYDAAFANAAAGDARHLEVALENNLYGTVLEPPPGAVAAVADYLRRVGLALAGQPLTSLLQGVVSFPTAVADAGTHQEIAR